MAGMGGELAGEMCVISGQLALACRLGTVGMVSASRGERWFSLSGLERDGEGVEVPFLQDREAASERLGAECLSHYQGLQ